MRAGGFAGAWFYPGAIIESPGVAPYAAESIEMLIGEERGKVRGSFHGQYSIPRRAAPSDVNFSFAGSRRGPICGSSLVGRSRSVRRIAIAAALGGLDRNRVGGGRNRQISAAVVRNRHSNPAKNPVKQTKNST
jgi:hypothetical protein